MSVTSPDELNVLFIGNSFTARNNVPGMIADMALARGLSLEYRLINVGGASLRMHWNRGAATEAIQRNKYDYVVLQEQSTLPIKNPTRMHESIRLFDPVIRAAGAKTALYLTWARQHAPDTQRAITDAYESIAREIGATVVPVGVVWEKLLSRDAHPVLHDKDRSHPSFAGSYLAACVFFAVLFRQSPVGFEPPSRVLSAADARMLQEAGTAVLH